MGNCRARVISDSRTCSLSSPSVRAGIAIADSVWKARKYGNQKCSIMLLMLAALRFLWNATRGHRLRPWRSEYLKWRIETYSGKKAESLQTKEVLHFLWQQKWALLRFLRWTGEMESLKKLSSRGYEER